MFRRVLLHPWAVLHGQALQDVPTTPPFICFQIGPTLPSKLSSFTSYTRDHQFRAEAGNFSCPLNTINNKTFCAPVAHYAEQFQSLITPPWTSLFDTTSLTSAAFMNYEPILILKVSSPICSTTMTTLQTPTKFFSSGSAQVPQWFLTLSPG